MINLIKKIISFLPESLEKKILYTSRMIFNKKFRWMVNNYWKFGQDNRRKIFLSAARYMTINRPINGYYFEFGCNEANTFRMAFNTFKNLFNLKYVAFDSFEGLPVIEEIDKMEVFKKGKLAFKHSEFVKLVKKEGIKDEDLIIIKGFYNETLNEKLVKKLSPTKAAVIYVDCDLYTSTVDVLNFIKFFLQPGTILIFDDWNCFYGDNERGQRKAFREFLILNKNLQFEEFVSDAESKSFVFIKYLD